MKELLKKIISFISLIIQYAIYFIQFKKCGNVFGRFIHIYCLFVFCVVLLIPHRVFSKKLISEETEKMAQKKELLLTTGEDKIIDIYFDAHTGKYGISIGNPKVVATTLVRIGNKKQLVFKPLSPGETTVTVRNRSGFVKVIFKAIVTGANLQKIAHEIGDLLKDVDGIKVRVFGKKVILDGELIAPVDYGRVYNVISDPSYKGTLLSLVRISPLALNMLAHKIQQDINVFAPNVKTRVVNGIIWLEGSVNSRAEAKRAQAIAESYMPAFLPATPIEKDPSIKRRENLRPIRNFLVVNPPPAKKQQKLVRVTIHFVELSKDYAKAFGFKWQPGFTSDPQLTVGTTTEGSTGASGLSFTATLSSLLPKLQSAQNAGYARVLKTSTLVVRSSQVAKSTDETDIPFISLGPSGQPVPNSKRVGISVSVTPTILGKSQDIQMNLDLKQANLVGRSGNNVITSQHSVSTKIYVKSGESAAVSATTSTDIQTSYNKDDPSQGGFTGKTSPLFTLLRTKSYNKKKSQFVIFVTPQIIENASEGTKDLRRNFRIKVR